MSKNKPKIAISCGDPAGIGPEVILKACASLSRAVLRRITVFGDLAYFEMLEGRLKTGVPILNAETASANKNGVRVASAGEPLDFAESDFGKVDKRYGAVAMASVEKAARSVLEGEFDALVTAPINKESANLAGYNVAGHTEFLARLCGGVPVAMMLACDKLKVVVATTHIALKDVPRALTRKKVLQVIRIIDSSMKKMTGQKPRIAVCGLNPHASDGGLFGDEEEKVIRPAIEDAIREGMDISGPHPADTMFTKRYLGTYDVALAMYHDQGLVPVKLLGFGKTVNITLGLPFLRVSVDHGTAFDIAGRNEADGRSMAHAIRTAFKILSGNC